MIKPSFSWNRQPRQYVSAVDDAVHGLVAVVMDIGHRRPRLLACKQVEASGLSLEALKRLAGDLPKRLPWVWTCSREQYNLMVLEKPPVPASELHKSLRWALESRVDFPTEEAMVVWMDVPHPSPAPGDAEHLHVVAAHKDTVRSIAQTFAEATLPLEVVDIRETAQRNIAALIEQDDECLALMSFEPQGVLLTFTWRGELYLDRFFIQPLQEIEQANPAERQRILDRVVSQYLRSLDFISSQYGFLQVRRLMLGPLPFEFDMVSAMAGRLPHPVQKVDLAALLEVNDQTGAEVLASSALQARLWYAIGAGLRYEGTRS
ncbi:MAG: type IV pilus biogenesis protein PilM [Limnohabitans sp.]